MKILVATEKPFAKVAVDGIKNEAQAAGHEVVLLEKYTTEQELLDAVAEVDAMIIRSDKVTPTVMDAAKNLKIVVRAGAGYDNVDTAYAKQKGIVVENTPGQNSNAVAELEFGMLLYAVRNFFNGKAGSELKGKKLGILAYGNIGRNVARIANGFGMDVYVYNRSQVKDKEGIQVVETREDIFKLCDIVSVHFPANDQTKKCINYDLISLMKNGGIIVNTARKEIIDEEGLLKAMNECEKLAYLTDIMPEAHEEFQKFEGRYFATPKKMGAQTAEANINAGIAAAKQIVSFFKDGDTTFQVNK